MLDVWVLRLGVIVEVEVEVGVVVDIPKPSIVPESWCGVPRVVSVNSSIVGASKNFNIVHTL